MTFAALRQERRSAVALLFAISTIPVVGLVGLAIDYGIWNQTYASVSLAASSAALNAVKIANAANLNNDPNAQIEGQTAGKQWFISQFGPNENAAHFPVPHTDQVKVAVTVAATTTATVSYSDTVPPIFGALFGSTGYQLAVTAKAEIIASPFLNVEILVDDSSSMQIGATPGDIAAMMYLTPCNIYGAVQQVPPLMTGGYSSADQTFNGAYSCNGYDGTQTQYSEESCPIIGPAGIPVSELTPGTPPTLAVQSSSGGPACNNLGNQQPFVFNGKTYSNQPYLAGAPCAFACHSSSAALSANSDYYGLARSTVANSTLCSSLSAPFTAAQLSACAITLRFDLVKSGVNQVISTMQSDNLAINNLRVGVFTFTNDVTQVYPSPQSGCAPVANTGESLACQASNDWPTALSDVGLPPQPPTIPDQADSGIKASVITPAENGSGNTNIHQTLTNLATNYLTPSGDGSSQASPLKVLFLVTDGMADYTPAGGSRVSGAAISPDDCQLFKNMGYAVYVLYTPYYPLTNPFYLTNTKPIAEGTGSNSLIYNMKACSSDPANDFIAASPSDSNSVNVALQKFLKRALAAAARFTE
jgi:Flp pilus assembly protein TadG